MVSEMLRYLTHKLRTQSLNESEPYKTDDDRDSGTESDDEGADIEELQKYMESLIQLESRPRVRKLHHHHHHSHKVGVENEVTTRPKQQQQTDPYPVAVDSALPSDVHSSEEELEVINAVHKRKWRGDDEDAPLPRFSASPPPHARRPFGGHLPPLELCAGGASPRKRYRRAAAARPPQHRPCLDFEKMQQINRVRLL